MVKVFKVQLLLAGLILCVVSSGFALSLSDLGTQITINDGIANSSGSQALGAAGEDNETETGTVASQAWDLEGMFWNSKTQTLFVIAGFNFDSGVENEAIGDLFLGSAAGDYGYALDFQRDYSGGDDLRASGSFTLYDDVTEANWVDPNYVDESTPYLFTGEADAIEDGTYATRLLDWRDDLAVRNLFAGWSGNYRHYVLSITAGDTLASLIDSGLLLHLTLECGNDTIHGQASSSSAPVPEPATMLLLGTGLLGLAGMGKKRSKK